MLWAWGAFTPQLLNELSSLLDIDLDRAANGTLDRTLVSQMSSLGTHGLHPQNMNGQLMNMMGKHFLPAPQAFLAPLSHKVLGWFSRSVNMIWPHELFSAIYHNYKEAWRTRVCPGTAVVSKFWDSVSHSDHFKNHPVRHRANFRTHGIPLSIHGDETPVVGIGKGWSKQLTIMSWQSLLVTNVFKA